MTHTILYIEDQFLNVQLVKKMLKPMPYRVLDASTGKSGLLMAQMHMPDLILMDVSLPDMNGLDLAALIKTYPSLRDIPIVVFTADTSHTIYQRCLEIGCVAYLNKPISTAYLLRVVQQVMFHELHV